MRSGVFTMPAPRRLLFAGCCRRRTTARAASPCVGGLGGLAPHARQRGGSWFNAATARVLHRPHLREGDDVPLVSVPPSAPQSTATGAVGVSGISSHHYPHHGGVVIVGDAGSASGSCTSPAAGRTVVAFLSGTPGAPSCRCPPHTRRSSSFRRALAICQPHAPTSARLPGTPVRRRHLADPRPTQQRLVSQVQQLRGPAHGLHSRMVLGSHDVHRIRCATAILVAFLATGETLPRAIHARDSPGPASPTRRRHRGALLGLTFSFTVARSAATW